MDKDLLALIKEILNRNNATSYPALKNLFKYVAIPFCHFDIIVGHKNLFRSRLHTDKDNEFFHN